MMFLMMFSGCIRVLGLSLLVLSGGVVMFFVSLMMVIVLLLVVVAQTLVPALFYVEFVNTVVAADDLLQLISLLKAETVKPN